MEIKVPTAIRDPPAAPRKCSAASATGRVDDAALGSVLTTTYWTDAKRTVAVANATSSATGAFLRKLRASPETNSAASKPPKAKVISRIASSQSAAAMGIVG